ncbi:MAG TPA: BTAD domain-containing putative transcriptional regulator [Natronosporangium sp.]
MRVEVLGPLRVLVGGHEIAVRAGRDRTLLTMLALRANQTVPVDELVDALWSSAPLSARNQVQSCVSHLRRTLSQQAGVAEDVIATDPAGYRLRVDPEQVDVHRFSRLVSRARAAAAAGRQVEARDQLRAALELWRGPALAGFDSPELSRTAGALEEERIQALEERIELDLALGAGGELVGELSDLVQRYPYREGIYASLMRALYRAGRMNDALATFRQARQRLHDELGTEPSEQLQRLHQAILNRDELAVGGGGPGAEVTRPPVPHQLPPEVAHFVGRDKEIAALREALMVDPVGSRRRPSVVLLYGPGGVGKSALAVRVAHELADAYPDGQLYVDLCGWTPGMRPLGALEVLARFLRSFGVRPSDIPADEAEAAAMFRSVTADRRLLLLLDNAASKDQVAPLLPANPACAVLVTTRHPQPSLDVDVRMRVAVLDESAAWALLTGLMDRRSHDEAILKVLALSDGLPLAIRIAGGRLAARPDVSAAEFAARLADRSRRLDELQLGDLAVRASVRTSYDALRTSGDELDRLAARALRLLGLLKVADASPVVVAAMLSEPDTQVARTALDRLVDAQLLEASSGRYRLHDLVRLVAAERAVEDEPRVDREAAVVRAMAYYANATWRANRRLHLLTVLPFGGPTTSAGVLAPTFVEAGDARRWIEDELSNLLSVMEQAVLLPTAHRRIPLWLGHALWNALDIRCSWQSAHELSRLIMEAADRRGDQELAACGYLLHGWSEACLGNYAAAKACFERALTHFDQLDNQLGTALVLNGLGLAESRQGNQRSALRYFERALPIARDLSLGGLSAAILNNMCVTYSCLRQPDRAIRAAEEAMEISSPEDHVTRTAGLISLSGALCLKGSYLRAAQRVNDAIQLSQLTGDRRREGEALLVRCEVRLRQGHLQEALADAERAAAVAEVSGYRYAKAAAWRQQQRILAAMGRTAEAAQAGSLSSTEFARLRGSLDDPLIGHLITDDVPIANSQPVPAAQS